MAILNIKNKRKQALIGLWSMMACIPIAIVTGQIPNPWHTIFFVSCMTITGIGAYMFITPIMQAMRKEMKDLIEQLKEQEKNDPYV